MLLLALAAAGPLEDLEAQLPEGCAAVVAHVGGGETRFTALGTASPDDRFEVGSITKVFTTMGMMALASQGLLSLDQPLDAWFPEAPDGVTLRQLSAHTSGLPRLPPNLGLLRLLRHPTDPYAGYDGEDLRRGLARSRPKTSPGEEWAYSNFGAGTLGAVLAEASGKRWEQVITDEVLRPLGLEGLDTSDEGVRSGHSAKGVEQPHWHFDALAGAGALRGSTRDMARFVELWASPEQAPLAPVWTPMLEEQHRVEEQLSMGLGWLRQEGPEGGFWWHNGGTGGFASFVAFEPERGLGLVLLADVALHGAVTQAGMEEMRVHIEETPPAASLGLDWLLGCWEGSSGEGRFRECWTRDGDGLVGTGQSLAEDGSVGFEESLRVVLEEGRAVYIAQPGSAPPVRFPASEVGPQRARFENPEHDFPKSLDYSRDGDLLHVEVRGEGGGFDLDLTLEGP